MVNLAPARLAVEKLMTDRGKLRRNPGGPDDDVLNPNPGSLELSPGGLPVPYYDGPMTIKISAAAANGETGSAASFPIGIVPLEGDFLEVAEALDGSLVGRWFRVDEVKGGTFAVSRRVVLAEVAPQWADEPGS